MSAERWSPDQLVAANEDAAAFFRRQLLGPPGQGPRRYLTDRGFERLLDDTIWTVGYAPAAWTALHDHLSDLGYTNACQQATGLITTSRHGRPIDRFRDRITFGVRDLDHSLTGFVARSGPGASPAAPRYLNTPSTQIYDKSETLFGLGEQTTLLHASATPVLVEGPLDAIAIHLARSTAARHVGLALCGTALTTQHLDKALVGGPNSATLFFDADTPGQQAMRLAYRHLYPRVRDVTAITPASGSDPADILQRGGGPSLLAELTSAKPAADAIIDRQLDSWPTAQTGVEADLARLRELARLIADIPCPDVARQAVRLRERLPFDHKTIAREFADAISPVRRKPASASPPSARTLTTRSCPHLASP